jgi:hypothetical protein
MWISVVIDYDNRGIKFLVSLLRRGTEEKAATKSYPLTKRSRLEIDSHKS